jgi:seryl-tRNA synthetase
VALGEKHKQMDFEAAGRISGARFVVLSGHLARLHRALAQLCSICIRDTAIVKSTFLPVNPQVTGTASCQFGQDLFAIQGESNLYLIPTAEVPLTNLVRDRIIEADELPLRFVAHSPCFRSEAGSYGKDTRGMIRQHQFEKVELVHIVKPQDSYAALEELTGHAEKVLQPRLPHCVSTLCAGDVCEQDSMI